MVIHDSDRANGKEVIKKPHPIRLDWYSVQALHAKAPLTILKSVACIRQKIWDEEKQEMISFPHAGQLA
ncbi:hypothetical protein KKI24_20400 [bacterium]|nr:hypothetical protein [bacterium]